MATLHPFRALRPVPSKAREVAAVPYDTVDAAEARRLAENEPLSFLRVTRPEIELPEDTSEDEAAVFERGAENLRAYAGSEHAIQDEETALYVYRLTVSEHTQTGICGLVSVAEYDAGAIVTHEETRPAKVQERKRLILAQHAHAEPVLLAYRDAGAAAPAIAAATEAEPLYDVEADDGVRHTLWKVAGAGALTQAFQDVPALYVADGHHRCAAASAAAHELRSNVTLAETPGFEFFPAVLFPMDELRILPYNRVVYRLPVSPEAFMVQLTDALDVKAGIDYTTPQEKGKVCLYLDGQWHEVTLPPSRHATTDARLDVARLNEYLLGPLLGIDDPRTDENLGFVGGIRGADELAHRVDDGEAALAISMYPTSMDELVAVSEAGLRMPPKSTWFEPKLRSGLLVHMF